MNENQREGESLSRPVQNLKTKSKETIITWPSSVSPNRRHHLAKESCNRLKHENPFSVVINDIAKICGFKSYYRQKVTKPVHLQ